MPYVLFYRIAGSQTRRYLTENDRYTICDIGEAFRAKALTYETKAKAEKTARVLSATTLETWEVEPA